MLKKFTVSFIMIASIIFSLIFSSFFLFPETAIAEASNCSASDITYKPTTFLGNPNDLTLYFEIAKGSNTLTTLKDKPVRLYLVSDGIYVTTKSISVSGNTFSINALDIDNDGPLHNSLVDGLKRPQDQKAILQWKPDPNTDFKDFCSGINYSVGNLNTCLIDPTFPSEIPPGKPVTIKFSGRPITEYSLQKSDNQGRNTLIKTTKTNNDGQGSFDSVLIPGNDGDSFDLILTTPGNDVYCRKPIKILNNAAPVGLPPPAVPPPGPPAPAAPVDICKDPSKCSKGGGESCTTDPENPGMKTAIGCIHTNPAELVKDLLKFIIAISGGLAFLMMLLGAFEMLTSSGNPESLNNGRSRVTSAVIGLLFVIFAVLLMQVIGWDILRLEGFGK